MTDSKPILGGPLKGIKIVDITATLMGPYSTQIMADMGAEVIKIESPAGDIMRYVGKNGAIGMGGIHININRGKELMCLDLKQPEAREVVRRLIKEADVFIHSMRPKAIERMGFGYEAVRELKNDIVYIGAYGFGAEGPYGDEPAYDDLIQGFCGLADIAKHMVGEPRLFPTLIADKTCGLTLAYAMLGAIVHRLRTGEGQKVEVPMFESMVQFMMIEHLGDRTFGENEPIGYARALSQLRRPHRTTDGFICVLPYHDKNWRDFFMIVGRPDLAVDPRFTSQAQRSLNYEVLYGMLGEFIATQSSEFWMEKLGEKSIPVGPVVKLEDLPKDPHLVAVDLFQQIDHPDVGEITAIRSPINYSASPTRMGKPAGLVGADTTRILKSVGFSDAEVAEMLAKKAAIQAKAAV